MEKQQLIDYILNSPENTNPAILNQMIDEVGGGDIDLEPQLLYNGEDLIDGSYQNPLISTNLKQEVWNSCIKEPFYYKVSFRFNNTGEFLECRNDTISIQKYYDGFNNNLTTEYSGQYINSDSGFTIDVDLVDNDTDESYIMCDQFPENTQSVQIYIQYVP